MDAWRFFCNVYAVVLIWLVELVTTGKQKMSVTNIVDMLSRAS